MLLTVITFFLLLSILVFVHELGHFLVANWAGVFVEEFGFGLPPRIFGKKFGETVLSLNWLPIGGFVKLFGEDEATDTEYLDAQRKQGVNFPSNFLRERSFQAKSKKARAFILSAGVIMNLFLAIGITAVLLTLGVREPTGFVTVEKVVSASPADKVGLEAGDVIVGLERYPKITLDMNPPYRPKTPTNLIEFVNANKGIEILILLERNGVAMSVRVTPRIEVPVGEGPLGIAITDLELHKYSWREAPVKAIVINATRAKEMFVSLGQTVWKLITFQKLTADVAGPIGIAQVTGQAVKFGWQAVLELASILSLNLAIINILPIPALDGGRLLFVFLEKILGKRVKPAFERSTHQIGMIVLLALILFVSVNDIMRIMRGG